MTNPQEGRIHVFGSVSDCLKNYRHVLDDFHPFAQPETDFNTFTTELKIYVKDQKNNKKGMTLVIKNLKKELVNETSEVTRKLSAFALSTNNVEIQQNCTLSPSRLAGISSVSLYNHARMLHDIVQINLPALGNYNLNETTQATFLASIENYWSNVCETKNKRNRHVRNTQLINELIKKADEALRKMSVVAEIVRNTHPEFYSDFKKSRRRVVIGSGSLVLRGLVSDKHTGKPIQGATLTFIVLDHVSKAKGTEVLMKKSAEKGRYMVKNLSSGTYIVKVHKVGYPLYETTLVIDENKLQVLEIELSMN